MRTDLDKTKARMRALVAEHDALLGERDSLRAMVDKASAPGERAETTYLNIIGGLLGLMLGRTLAGKPQSVFDSQASIIDALLITYPGKPGIAESTLKGRLSDAKKSINQS